MAHAGLPRNQRINVSKRDVLASLSIIDADGDRRSRVLQMETEFRRRINTHLDSLPQEDSVFDKFKTSPFVIMFYAYQKGYTWVHEVEEAILPAKVFSSMETSAGRMLEAITLPIYGWQVVESEMHTPDSALDGKRIETGCVKVATLKSGPRCLNDEMSENFADAIKDHTESWANSADVSSVEFTYGVLYGTKAQSNKKDWHILRKLCEKLDPVEVLDPPNHKWNCSFAKSGINASVTVRVGLEWWEYLTGDRHGYLEICCALIRACVIPSAIDAVGDGRDFKISDLGDIISTDSVPSSYNISLLQKSQIEWVFFLVRHFCDSISV